MRLAGLLFLKSLAARSMIRNASGEIALIVALGPLKLSAPRLVWKLPATRQDSLLFSLLVVLSSFLLFLLEPMIGKQILPWFGGAAAVWATCLVFYQSALLVGYIYAARIGHFRWVHSAALAISLILLPVGPSIAWSRPSELHPVWRILALLSTSTGLPFMLLSATSPLLQRHLASRGVPAPYWLFIVSNAASFAGLFAYPLLIEPALGLQQQRWLWSSVYVLFALFSLVSIWLTSPLRKPLTAPVQPRRVALWFLLSAAGSMLLLAITNHLTENVAPVPLLWILPLAVYLASFMLAFTGASQKRALWSGMAVFGLVLLAYAIYDIDAVEPIQITLPVLLFGLFASTMLCHSELYRSRPEPGSLAAFYVAIAAGGAAGSIFVGVLAPNIFLGISELPVAMCVVAALAIAVNWDRGLMQRLLWTTVAVAMAAVFYVNVQSFARGTLAQMRSFYGALRVVQSGLGSEQARTLYHGSIEHGSQFLLLPMRRRPTTYYAPDSGIGIALRECVLSPKRVGVIGLGAGTLAAYGHPGDSFHFYEINPQVLQLANATFFYLRESPAKVDTEIGDARLALQRDHSHTFDLLAVDAFSGDAIPVHLLTREALKIYRDHLTPEGIIAFHVSNNYLDLASVVQSLAQDAGMGAALFRNHDDPDTLALASDWVLVTTNVHVFNNASLQLHRAAFSERNLQVWTDEHSDLLSVFKTPALQR